MREVNPKWRGAVLVCTHDRPVDGDRAYCGSTRGSALRTWLKDRMGDDGLKGVVLTAKSGCLGVCSKQGVTVAALPEPGENQPRKMWIFEDGDDREVLFEALRRALTEDGGPKDKEAF